MPKEKKNKLEGYDLDNASWFHSLSKQHQEDALVDISDIRQQGYEEGRAAERERVKEIIKNEVKIEKSAPPANELEKTAEWYLISGFERILSALSNDPTGE